MGVAQLLEGIRGVLLGDAVDQRGREQRQAEREDANKESATQLRAFFLAARLPTLSSRLETTLTDGRCSRSRGRSSRAAPWRGCGAGVRGRPAQYAARPLTPTLAPGRGRGSRAARFVRPGWREARWSN